MLLNDDAGSFFGPSLGVVAGDEPKRSFALNYIFLFNANLFNAFRQNK